MKARQRKVGSKDELLNKNKRVQVVIRPRPFLSVNEASALVDDLNHADYNGKPSSIWIDPRDSAIKVCMKRDNRHANGKAEAGKDVWSFQFDQVLEQNCSQQDVFDACMRDMLENALIGFNGTILAYGQTGAGKTHTMTGKQHILKERGLAARTVSTLFQEMEKRAGNSTFTVRVSYLEIYNEQLYDLLDGNGDTSTKKELKGTMQIHSDETGNTFMNGLSRRVVRNEEEAFNCLFEGETNRVIGSHELNYSSTRSHCILTFYIEGRHNVFDESVGAFTETMNTSKLNLVDLAGSERIFKTNSTGLVLEEAKSINKSLSFLEQVVVALGEKQREHIPYRQSQLTHFLKDSLGGNCKSLLIACIWPALSHTEQTLATLKFATRMMRVKNEPVRNDRSTPDSAILVEYKKEVQQLRAELALRDEIHSHLFPDQSLSTLSLSHQPYTSEQRAAIREELETFICTGDRKHVKFHSVRHATTMFEVFRDIALEKSSTSNIPSLTNSNKSNNNSVPLSTPTNVVPNVEETTIVPQVEEKPEEAETEEEEAKESRRELTEQEREEMFARFKTKVPMGCEYNTALTEAKKSLLELKHKSKETKAVINTAKKSIDSLIQKLEANPENEEFVALLKTAKKQYKSAVQALKEVKSESSYASQVVKCCREKLGNEFEKWACTENCET